MKLYPTGWLGLAFGILRIAAFIYVVVLGLLFFCQERLIFFPSKLEADYRFKFKHPFEEKWLEIDGTKIHSLLLKVQGSKGLILYFHGNADNLASWGEVADDLVEQTSMNVWILDYPGYGKSEGHISSEGQLHNVAKIFMDAAVAMQGSADKVTVYGRSIGTGLAVKLAADYKPAALILESPYYSLQNMAEERFAWAPLFLLNYKFHSDLWMPNVSSPVLIFHGDRDELVPFAQGKRLAGLAKVGKFVPVHGGHHNNLADFPEYWSSLKGFLFGNHELK